MNKNTGDGELTPDKFYGQLDSIIMWCFTLGFNAARREYGELYKSAKEAEPNYEDNLDSWMQDIITSHEELLAQEANKTVAGIVKALTDKGSHPAYHDEQMRYLETHWPVLYFELRKLLTTDYFKALGHDKALDEVKSVIQNKLEGLQDGGV